MLRQTRPEIIDLIRQNVTALQARMIDDGKIRMLGVFLGPCLTRTYVVIRVARLVPHGRRVLLLAITEWLQPDGVIRYRAGAVPKVQWSTWLHSQSDVSLPVIARLVKKESHGR